MTCLTKWKGEHYVQRLWKEYVDFCNLEDVICKYGCVRKITTDREELDAKGAREFFLANWGLNLH